MRRLKSLLTLPLLLVTALAAGVAFAQEVAPAIVPASPAKQVGFQLFDLLYPVLLALVGWLSVFLQKLINAKAKNALVAGILGRFKESVLSAVKKVGGTLKASILKAKDPSSPGGTTITEEEGKQCFDAVLDELKAEYGGWDGIKEFLAILGLGNVEQWVATQVEAAVHDVNVTVAASKAPLAAAVPANP